MYRLFCPKEFFLTFVFYLNGVLNTLSGYTYFYISKKKIYFIHFLLIFKIVESLQCILNTNEMSNEISITVVKSSFQEMLQEQKLLQERWFKAHKLAIKCITVFLLISAGSQISAAPLGIHIEMRASF